MSKQVLLGLGALLLVSATVTLIVRKSEKDPLLQNPMHPSRDDLNSCTVQNCFHASWECQKDQACVAEAIKLNQQYMDHPTDFEQIFLNIQSPYLREQIECQKKCGAFEYLKRCAKEDVYIKKCLSDEKSLCQAENRDYFDNYKACQISQYKTCSGIVDKEAFSQCYLQEIILCASERESNLKGYFNHAMNCA